MYFMRGKMPTHKQIVEDSKDLLLMLNINKSDAIRMCWACRIDFLSSLPVRAHIVADKHGSSNQSNYFLLCNDCHSAQPDASPYEYQIEWIKRYKPAEGSNQEIISQWFEQMTDMKLSELLDLMIDQWGTQGMLDRFRVALQKGSYVKAGPKNGMANAVYELYLILTQLVLSPDDR